jgi:hypothetical protein
MLSFHRISLMSSTLAGATRDGEDLFLSLGSTSLTLSPLNAWQPVCPGGELGRAISDWSVGPIHPAIATMGPFRFGGFIDKNEGSFTLQREHLPTQQDAMAYAICAARLRLVSDRSGMILPATIIPFSPDVAPYLAAAPRRVLATQTTTRQAIAA